MKRVLLAVAVFGLVVAACGGDGGDAGSCADIADEGIAAIQEVINEIDTMSLDDLTALGSEDPEFITDMETRMDELDERSTELGCSDEELAELVQDRVGDLSADSEFGQLMIDQFSDSGIFE